MARGKDGLGGSEDALRVGGAAAALEGLRGKLKTEGFHPENLRFVSGDQRGCNVLTTPSGAGAFSHGLFRVINSYFSYGLFIQLSQALALGKLLRKLPWIIPAAELFPPGHSSLSCPHVGDKDTREPVPALGSCSEHKLTAVSQEFIPINHGECGMLFPAAAVSPRAETPDGHNSPPGQHAQILPSSSNILFIFFFFLSLSLFFISKIFLSLFFFFYLFPGIAACESPAPSSCLGGGDAEG